MDYYKVVITCDEEIGKYLITQKAFFGCQEINSQYQQTIIWDKNAKETFESQCIKVIKKSALIRAVSLQLRRFSFICDVSKHRFSKQGENAIWGKQKAAKESSFHMIAH